MQYLLFYQLEYWQILKIYPFSSIPLVKVYKKLVIHKKGADLSAPLIIISSLPYCNRSYGIAAEG